MPVYQLDEEIWFPRPELAEKDGLLAVGGDLSEERLILAYSNGIFPWYNPGEEILWWCPKERFVIFPAEIHISHSMRKFLKKTDMSVTFNTEFERVMHNCRLLREEEGTWISDEMERAYNWLHQRGYAVSAETWKKGKLVGGLYGVCIGRNFFGESMFSTEENASKIALITLARQLEEQRFEMIDCQFHTDHLESMGGRYIPYKQYIEFVRKGMEKNRIL